MIFFCNNHCAIPVLLAQKQRGKCLVSDLPGGSVRYESHVGQSLHAIPLISSHPCLSAKDLEQKGKCLKKKKIKTIM